ncbi:hypothetical protein CIG75_03190 [Tumebacillus algifaecis]|uniref:Uncharacterized protein n=1 Tax=Tumebacillus algifaecis TaxID=1214604 RepID=A0A223CY50_9BACL|nr:hypothetical protein [Tumebacillus algifaecis]ASS74087.1 hypothetical protein CIG75_03190 [Tumebacillus algifaecis]
MTINIEALKQGLDDVRERHLQFESEVKDELSKIKDTLVAQAVANSRNETILSSLVEEIKSFRSEFMNLLTESVKASNSQNSGWHELAVKVVMSVLALAAAAYGVSKL